MRDGINLLVQVFMAGRKLNNTVTKNAQLMSALGDAIAGLDDLKLQIRYTNDVAQRVESFNASMQSVLDQVEQEG